MTDELFGTRVHYELLGNGDSRVVLLHGWGCDLSLMRPVADALAGDHQVLLLDFPGHGQSGRPPEPWDVSDYAGCLKELLGRLRFTPCSVVAHSFGCRVAAWLAAEEPALFDRMIFTGAAGLRPRETEESRKRSARYQRLKKVSSRIGAIPFLRSTAKRFEERLKQKYGSRDYLALDEEMRKTFVKVINQDLSACYPRIRQSTLLIWGDADTETPLWMGKEMEKLIPDAGLVILEGGDHFAYLRQIQRFNTIAKHFLKEQSE